MRGAEGQTSVELALTLPLAFMMLLIIVQSGLFVRDQVMVTHAAREAARVAAVSADPGRVQSAARNASGLDPSRIRVTQTGRGQPGSSVTIRIDYEAPVRVPLIGVGWHSLHLSSQATMRVER